MGLLPIGEDPASGLWEFSHLATGDPAVRGDDGKLVLTDETGIVLVLIPGGTFWMGAQIYDPDEQNHDPNALLNESPVHEVTLSPYFLSKYEMTQGQWQRATANNPSQSCRVSRAPVESVSWVESLNVMARLGLELPSEAQWEYACRAGTDTPWWHGADLESLRGRVNILAGEYLEPLPNPLTMAFLKEQEERRRGFEFGGKSSRRVGSYPANSLGLHDVHGNVSEWCRDGYTDDAYRGAEHRRDPIVPWAESPYRSLRGGCWSAIASFARTTKRSYGEQGSRSNHSGLRPGKAISVAE